MSTSNDDFNNIKQQQRQQQEQEQEQQQQVTKNVLVLGATGNTGKHVVRQLLNVNNHNRTTSDNDIDHNNNHITYNVQVIVRSKQRFLRIINSLFVPSPDDDDSKTNTDNNNNSNTSSTDTNLNVVEGSILEISDNDLDTYVTTADTIVVCLGHVLSFRGVFGPPYRLVYDTVRRITDSMVRVSGLTLTTTSSSTTTATTSTNRKKQIILMNSDGVPCPNDTIQLSYFERFLFFLIRTFLPPHSDNEYAANYLHTLATTTHQQIMEWIIVRPCNLIEEEPTATTTSTTKNHHHNNNSIDAQYTVLKSPPGTTILFEYRTIYRSVVAQYIVHLIQNANMWKEWKFKCPYIENKIQHPQQHGQNTTTTK